MAILLQPAGSFAAGSAEVQPFEIREQNPFNLVHGQPLPGNAVLLGRSESRWSSSLIITNTVNIETAGNEDIYLDYESWRFNLSWQYGLAENWNLKIDAPLVHQGGGIFDSAIDSWHRFWGLPRGDRPAVENNQYDIRYAYRSQVLLDLSQPHTTLGDIQLALGRSLRDNSSTTVSLWAGMKLPVGDEDSLSSNGGTDFSGWLALNRKLAADWVMNMNIGAVIPGVSNYHGMPVSDQVFYGHVMLGWLLTDSINLKLQLQGHTSYYDQSELKTLGDTFFLVFGGTVSLDQCSQLDIAFSEDVYVDASPDASLLFNWRYYPSPACR